MTPALFHCTGLKCCIMQGCGVGVKDRDGCTPLYCAAAWNRLEAVKKLAALGCPSAVQSEEGRMSVHVAAEQGWTELIDVLVRTMHNQVAEQPPAWPTPQATACNVAKLLAWQPRS